jgi:hypothetical protein
MDVLFRLASVDVIGASATPQTKIYVKYLNPGSCLKTGHPPPAHRD